MESDVPSFFVRHSAFLFAVAERCIAPKAEKTIRQEEQMDIQEKIFSSPVRPVGILILPLEERLRRDREALRKFLSEV